VWCNNKILAFKPLHIRILALLGAARKQCYQPVALLTEQNSVPPTKINPVPIDAGTDTFITISKIIGWLSS
jgi:hypothetical protein